MYEPLETLGSGHQTDVLKVRKIGEETLFAVKKCPDVNIIIILELKSKKLIGYIADHEAPQYYIFPLILH